MSGDFDADGISDLVAGLPTTDDGGAFRAGAVEVHYGSGVIDWLGQSSLGLGPSDHNNFGQAMLGSPGDFNQDGFDDLAIVLGQDGQWPAERRRRLRAARLGQRIGHRIRRDLGAGHERNPLDVCETSDCFGTVLAVGNFGEDAADDLAIGVPAEDIGAVADAGGVNVIYGKVNVGRQSANNDFFSQNAGKRSRQRRSR